jgi:hypothetical protein
MCRGRIDVADRAAETRHHRRTSDSDLPAGGVKSYGVAVQSDGRITQRGYMARGIIHRGTKGLHRTVLRSGQPPDGGVEHGCRDQGLFDDASTDQISDLRKQTPDALSGFGCRRGPRRSSQRLVGLCDAGGQTRLGVKSRFRQAGHMSAHDPRLARVGAANLMKSNNLATLVGKNRAQFLNDPK